MLNNLCFAYSGSFVLPFVFGEQGAKVQVVSVVHVISCQVKQLGIQFSCRLLKTLVYRSVVYHSVVLFSGKFSAALRIKAPTGGGQKVANTYIFIFRDATAVIIHAT